MIARKDRRLFIGGWTALCDVIFSHLNHVLWIELLVTDRLSIYVLLAPNRLVRLKDGLVVSSRIVE